MRRARVAVICFLALAAGAVAAVLTAPRIYEGQMKILVKQDRADSVVSGAADHSTAPADLSETELLSQVELIRARDVLQKVAHDSGLAKRLLDSNKVSDDAEALALATTELREDLKVAPIKRTWLIDVEYSSDDPRLARLVLDTLVKEYLEKHLALHRPSGTYQFFSDQAEQARRDLETAQGRLSAFNRDHKVISVAMQKEGVIEKLMEIDAMRVQAAATLAETTQREEAISSELARVPPQHVAQVRTTDDAGVMQDVKSRILTLEMKRTELLQKFTPSYRGVVELDEQLKEARDALADARSVPVREETIADNPTRQWLDAELARARADNAAVRARVGVLSTAVSGYRAEAQTLEQREIEHTDLVRTLKAAEDKYLLYAQKQEEARISDELDRTRIANVVVAQPPAVAFKPRRQPSAAALPLLLGVALMVSLALAVAVDSMAPTVVMAARFHRVSRSIDELRRLNAQIDTELNSRGRHDTAVDGMLPIADAGGLS